jgi:DNA modification methylase
MEQNYIYHGDCLEIMQSIDAESVDMILCDLPYGSTRNRWDILIPLIPLWQQYKRIIKNNGVIALTGQGMFSAKLMVSNEDWYKYTLVWEKDNVTGHLNAKKQPLRKHEDVLIFYQKQPTYNPQFTLGTPYQYSHYQYETNSTNYGDQKGVGQIKNDGKRYPTSIIKIGKVSPKKEKILHPTQKPVELFEWLIKTYTIPGDIVLDSCIGSGTTAIAAINTGRSFIGIEKEKKYADLANQRIHDHIGLFAY